MSEVIRYRKLVPKHGHVVISCILFYGKVFKDGKLSHYIDGRSSPSNWMKYIRCARHQGEQNLAVKQHGEEIYYYTLREIRPGEELLVWYCYWSYDLYMGIPLGLRMTVKYKDMFSFSTGAVTCVS